MSTPEQRAAWQALGECSDATVAAVAREAVPTLLAEVADLEERLEAAEREREEWKDRRDRAVATCRFRHQDGLTAREWHLRICGAAQAADAAESEVDRLQAELDEHRAHYVDPQEYQRLRAGIEALADSWEGDSLAGDRYCARELRALLEES